jgi:Protein of unknown function (DUF1266)
MSGIVWALIAGGVLVSAVALWFFWPVKGCNHDCKHPRYLADRNDPMRYWVHGVMAVYRGDAGDPAYWDADCAQRQASGWGLEKPQDLWELIERYRDGEINAAFDKARLIWLARLGQGLGWLTEQQSWDWCRAAADELRRQYPSWPDFTRELLEGRASWYGGQMPPAELEQSNEAYRFASANVLPALAFR